MSQILQQESALSNVSTPIVSGKCAVQSNVIAFIGHLHDTRYQDLPATRRNWFVNANQQKEKRTEGLGGNLQLPEGGNEDRSPDWCGWRHGRPISFCLCVISSRCGASPRTVGRHHLISSLVWSTWNILSDMRRWHNDLRDCTSRNQATGHISLPY